ncbi:phosphoribosylformylglycinamidine synthase I [Haloferax mediterranei ATCC 33500]|uniref:Phosphoribosylformylglycinamidine synthase subunit PurQ n=1 Tax=Haloferax mediterranei (strain ATCC 33500 / DSM 1411 / JCM 8866 / NBRC 14739 / NCIMB 2177 / R-4) TaxID=523841 RepID=I3R6S4_HALMT|nr:phosphoribosylformylglycinamidine synthase I [Haloferax mediterranei]AFK19934.1 phosphoribosylformylglycinamidine synthase component I [Haloferax mediterranei ATCC 33500]AHZ23311.1 phosphoribosylformylglycinamidine synthase [Haloferax mediterranei ATCC 33500]ELZ99478.1 phosphoribosylformylglycinamidine synthase I [Haloferax mediterranei ATCC 33500]MDX5987316.1 phosphoribosylformylglycinamidine synthase I [Haloferax mediterranei ATCC 33500]QCQ73831.1 phosphoribosylformylglycinamidine synthas
MIAVVQFGGSNCDRDAVRALEDLGFEAERVWHEDQLPEETTGIMLPGGFSYGDYLRGGAMAARSPIMKTVREAVDDDLPVLGVCNGAQVGCESGLTPGAFTTNASARFQCEHVYLRVENADTPWTEAYEEGDVIELPIAHGEGRFEIDDEGYEELESEDRILFRYCDEDGNITDEANPNGSRGNVAGILGASESVAVLMPHPERASLPNLGNTDGRGVLAGFDG